MKGFRRRAGKRAGFLLIEGVVGLALLTLAFSVVLTVLVSYGRNVEANRDAARCQQAVRALLEEMQVVSISQVFATYNSDPADDPGGAGTAPGNLFQVAGLEAADGSTLVGAIDFPAVINGGGDLVLLEDIVDKGMSMPRDLNADGIVDSLDHSADYVLLPVRLRVAWVDSAGERSFVINHLLSVR